VGPNLDTAKSTRKAAITKANADFKAAMQAALTALKAALGTSGSPEPSASPKVSASPSVSPSPTATP
jgi:hypothetical protein